MDSSTLCSSHDPALTESTANLNWQSRTESHETLSSGLVVNSCQSEALLSRTRLWFSELDKYGSYAVSIGLWDEVLRFQLNLHICLRVGVIIAVSSLFQATGQAVLVLGWRWQREGALLGVDVSQAGSPLAKFDEATATDGLEPVSAELPQPRQARQQHQPRVGQPPRSSDAEVLQRVTVLPCDAGRLLVAEVQPPNTEHA
mmetsp:Transcript_150919/g.485011  ORF Transcript_150919/g.485011 Transcript_150919/m.485011 type:complete len:201 (-) Transcript_150919:1080-1682(-)